MEYSIFPIDIIRITQGQMGGYSHQGAYALDLVGTHNDYPIHAPYTGRIVKIDSQALGNAIYFQTIEPVQTPTGLKHLTTLMIHTNKEVSWFQNHILNQTVFNHNDIIYWSGGTGNVTGDHLHLEVAEGHVQNMIQNEFGNWVIVNSIPIESAFYFLEGFNYYSFINNLTIDLVKIDEIPDVSDYNWIRKKINGRWKTIPIRKR